MQNAKVKATLLMSNIQKLNLWHEIENSNHMSGIGLARAYGEKGRRMQLWFVREMSFTAGHSSVECKEEWTRSLVQRSDPCTETVDP